MQCCREISGHQFCDGRRRMLLNSQRTLTSSFRHSSCRPRQERSCLTVAAEPPDDLRVSADIIVDAPPRPAGTCKTCGVPLNEIPWGCNQEGRVAGGIGAIVGFDWWPIKAYKPCGKAVKAGVLYTRKGQITDEMLFGQRKDKK